MLGIKRTKMSDKEVVWVTGYPSERGCIAKVFEPIKLQSQQSFNKNKIVIVKKKNENQGKPLSPLPIYKRTIIYEGKGERFSGPPHSKVTIVNLLDLASKFNIRIVATFVDDSGKVLLEKTSDKIAQIIGTKNWSTILSALYSIIDQEQKARSVMALLTENVEKIESSCQTVPSTTNEYCQTEPSTTNQYCQTEQSSMNLLFKMKTSKTRQRRSLLKPYVVKKTSEPNETVEDEDGTNIEKLLTPHILKKTTKANETVENDSNFNELENFATATVFKEPQVIKEEDITIEEHNLTAAEPDIISYYIAKIEPLTTKEAVIERNVIVNEEFDSKALPILHLNEESNLSSISTFSNISNDMHPHDTKQLLDTIWECTEKTYIQVLDGSYVVVPVKPEDKFHYASPKTLRYLNEEDRKKLLLYQAYIDWKCCLEVDDNDGNFPIHTAVLNNDLDLLRRQCAILRSLKKSVDLIAQNLTPLQMSIFQDSALCTSLLLQNGADPFVTDEENRTALHLAAMYSSENVKIILEHCRKKPKDILQSQSSLWKDDYEGKSNDELAKILLDHMCSSFDSQDRESKSTVAEHFKKTIIILIENGADPNLNNFADNNVVLLLSEFSNAELSQLILSLQVDSVSSKVTGKKSTIRLGNGELSKNCSSIKNMIVIDDIGNVDVKEIKATGRKYVDAEIVSASKLNSLGNSEDSREFSAESPENAKTNQTPHSIFLPKTRTLLKTSRAKLKSSRGNTVDFCSNTVYSRDSKEDSRSSTVKSRGKMIDSNSNTVNSRGNTVDYCINTVNTRRSSVDSPTGKVDYCIKTGSPVCSRTGKVDYCIKTGSPVCSRTGKVDYCIKTGSPVCSRTGKVPANRYYVKKRPLILNSSIYTRANTENNSGNTVLSPGKILLPPKEIPVTSHSANFQSKTKVPGKIIVSPKNLFHPVTKTISANERSKFISTKPVILENVCLRKAEDSERSLLIKRRKIMSEVAPAATKPAVTQNV